MGPSKELSEKTRPSRRGQLASDAGKEPLRLFPERSTYLNLSQSVKREEGIGPERQFPERSNIRRVPPALIPSGIEPHNPFLLTLSFHREGIEAMTGGI